MGLSFWLPLGYQEVEPFQPSPLPLLRGNTVIEQPVALDRLIERYVDAGNDFIFQNAETDRPFFLYMAFNHVHIPNSCSVRFCGSSKQGPLGDAVQELDWAVGRIMQTLHDAGVEENTLVLFTSDNGAPLVNDAQGNIPLRDGKASTWEGGFRVPGIARWLGNIKPRQVSHSLVSTLDVFPTLVALAGVSCPLIYKMNQD